MAKLRVIGDIGNSLIKMIVLFDDGSRQEIVFPHAVIPISSDRFSTIKDKYGASDFGDISYFELDGQPYVVGDNAEQYGMLDRRSGTLKYSRDYYGVLFIAGLLKVIPEGCNDISVFVCHPPSDEKYRKRQMRSLRGLFEVVTSGKKTVKYNVKYVNTFLEPVGGFMNIALDESGRVDDSLSEDGRALIFDVGGRITNVVPCRANGDIEYDRGYSAPVGILNVLEELESRLRSKYEKEFETTRVIPMDRLRAALRQGFYRGGGEDLDCAEEAEQSLNVLLNSLVTLYYERAGGPKVYDAIYITGGGGGAAEKGMKEKLLDHKRVYLAEVPQEMHFANVRGGEKLWLMLENENMLE